MGRESLTHLCIIFLRNKTGGPFRSEKMLIQKWVRLPRLERDLETVLSDLKKHDTEMGHSPTSRARPRDADHLRPSNIAARILRSVEHTPSKFWRDPCPVRRGLVAAAKCSARKTRAFLGRQRTKMTHYYRRHCSWLFCSMKGKPKAFLFSVFRSHNSRLQYLHKNHGDAKGWRAKHVRYYL